MVRGMVACPACAGASDPKNQTLSLLAQLGQSTPVDALSTEHVGVVHLNELFRCERFRRAKDHVPGVVDDDIETTVFLNDGFNSLVG
jgi:hypothetical protein